MIELEDYKKALGDVDDEGLSEEEIIKAMQIQDDLAELFYVMYVEKRNENTKEFNSFINEINKTYDGK